MQNSQFFKVAIINWYTVIMCYRSLSLAVLVQALFFLPIGRFPPNFHKFLTPPSPEISANLGRLWIYIWEGYVLQKGSKLQKKTTGRNNQFQPVLFHLEQSLWWSTLNKICAWIRILMPEHSRPPVSCLKDLLCMNINTQTGPILYSRPLTREGKMAWLGHF